MYCPKCGQERTSEATSFCSRCGYLLTGTAELLHTGGSLPGRTHRGGMTRRQGVKQGLFIFLLTFLVAPIVGLFVTFGLRMEPWPVGLVVALFGVGGVLRIIHALMFGERDDRSVSDLPPADLDPGYVPAPETATLPRLSVGVPDYLSPETRPGRLDTSDLEPRSVTEGTTKLLENDTPR
jgi:hypothetical protein